MKTYNAVKRLVESFFANISQSDSDFDDFGDDEIVQNAEDSFTDIGSIMYYHPDKGKNFAGGQPIAICVIKPGQLDGHPRYMMLNKIQTWNKNGISPKRFTFGGKVSSLKNLKKYTYDKYTMHDKIYDMPCMHFDIDGEKNTNALLDMNDPMNPYKAAIACVNNKIDIVYQDSQNRTKVTKTVPERQYIPTAAELIMAQDNLRNILKSLRSERDSWIMDETRKIPLFGGYDIKMLLDDVLWTSTCLSGNQVFAVYGSHPRWRLSNCDLTEQHEMWPFIKF